jgi:hypothetical protein
MFAQNEAVQAKINTVRKYQKIVAAKLDAENIT